MNQKTQLLSSLKHQGFSPQIINAFSKVDREKFVSEELKSRAYEDTALSIGQGQTISQPYTIAMMFELLELKSGQKVLEIGSGCGYVLALLSEIVGKKGEVFGIEIVKELSEKSKENLRDCKNVKVYNKNGAEGLEEYAPFDRILISAASEKVPQKVLNQLKDKGILVAPVGVFGIGQSLTSVQRTRKNFTIKEEIPGFVFVKFVGD